MKRYPLDVSIILVNYNTTKLLIQAIQSVYDKSSGFSFEIIVVDNNSIEDPRQPLLETFGNKVTLLRLSDNIGFGRANNEGIKIAKGRNIFYCRKFIIIPWKEPFPPDRTAMRLPNSTGFCTLDRRRRPTCQHIPLRVFLTPPSDSHSAAASI